MSLFCLLVGLGAELPPLPEGVLKALTEPPWEWAESPASLEKVAPATRTVLACTAREKAEVVKRSAAHLSTSMSVGDGQVIEGGGIVVWANCRPKVRVTEVLHGKGKPGERVVGYTIVESSDAFPGPRARRPIPVGARALLLLGEDGRVLRTLRDDAEARAAVRKAFDPRRKAG
jgi:hypothetical protein